jgi:tryptophan 6-halogenase
LQAALGEPFVSFASNLFNDSAIAMPTPNDPGAIRCETRATAREAGWVWKIPLTNRTGNGYVYASAFKSADEAETELRAHLGLIDSDIAARHLKMNVGQVRRSWVKNCLAVGLAQGFIEPLEATALHIVQATVEGFLDAYDADKGADAFNTDIAARYEGIRDYIVAHYRVNQRTDTDYWRANAANQHLSESLKAIMTCWFTGADLVQEIHDQGIAQYYAPLSWHCLLGGYGNYPEQARLKPPEDDLPLFDMARIDAFIGGCAKNFRSHDVVLEDLR